MSGDDRQEPLRILHLEDEAKDQELVRALFESEAVPCEIVTVDSREAFVAAIENTHFDLILSDFALPCFDGLSALKLAKERVPLIPLIFLSGTIGEEAAIEAVRSGATDYVLKQRLARLVPAVHRAVRESEARQRQRQIEESLRREREFSGLLVESSVDGILAFDRVFAITAWNAGLERMTGLARADVLGRSAAEWFPFLETLELDGDAPGATEPSTSARDVPFAIEETRRGGYLDASCSPLRDESGRVNGWLAILHDTTKERVLEEQFRQSQKMEAVGRLAGGVAHDFNNLLTAILGYSQLIRNRLVGQPELLADLDEVANAAHRATSLTRQLLAMSRRQVLKPQVLDLNSIIVDMDNLLCRLIGEDIDMRTVPTVGLGHVKADPGQVEQVIMNLVVNARDAMAEGGIVTLETANVVLAADRVGGQPNVIPGPYVLLAVSDTGSGMDPETRSRIFEPFFTTKEMGHGTGLGLSTVHGIVTQSGGHIEVYSELGHGTTFKIYFPRVDEDLEVKPMGLPRGADLSGTEVILLVEDDELVRAIASRTLRANGYTVVDTAHRQEALNAFHTRQQQGRSFDLVLSDVVMPGMGLSEFAERLARVAPALPILYMSGYTDRAILHQGNSGAIGAYLAKPFAIDDLLRAVRTLLDQRRRAA